MAREITEDQRKQWSAVHRQALTLAAFFDRKGLALTAAVRAAAEPSHPFGSRLAGLREALADMLEVSSDLVADDLRELDRHARLRLGISLDDLQAKRTGLRLVQRCDKRSS